MNQLKPWYRNLGAYEWIFFYAVALLNLLPAISHPVFPTLDGPAHLYNANVIYQLLLGDSDILSQYYAFNTEIVPNWGGHFLLAGLYTLLPPLVAGKVFIGLCLFMLPVSFRYCVRQLNADARLASYLIFPFTYTFLFCLGFYNFSVGLIVLFAAIGQFLAYRKQAPRFRSLALLFVLLLLAYLSHLFVFLSAGMVILFTCSLDVIQAFLRKEQLKETLKKAVLLLLVALPPLVLTLKYFLHAHHAGAKVYLLKSELMQWITSCRSIICYSLEEEAVYTTCVFFVLFFLASLAVYFRGKAFRQHAVEGKASVVAVFFLKLQLQDVFLLIVFAFLALYFRLPDSDPTAGFISSRLLLMVFLFLILWISGFHYPKWVMVLGLATIFLAQYKLVRLHQQTFTGMNTEIAEVLEVESVIRPHTVILPVNYSANWLGVHHSNYLGIRKPVVILENYECVNSYFPLTWHCDTAMWNLAHSEWNRLDLILEKTSPETFKRVDYVFVQGKEAFPDSLKTALLEHYSLRRETPHLLLFERSGK